MARPLPEVREALPPGKVPGGFARDFCLIFRDEITARFLHPTRTEAATAAAPAAPSSPSPTP